MTVAIAFTSQETGTTYNVVFENFTDAEFPRQWSSTAAFNRSGTGAFIQSGPRYQQKYNWTIDCLVETSVAEELDALYRAWDIDRAAGKSVAVGILDKCFGDDVSGAATFTVAPTYTYAGPRHTMVSLGLAQV